MEFILDQDYFNRAGDKVRYVGQAMAWNNDSRLLYFMFRKADGILCETDEAGKFLGGVGEHVFDVIGKWEINDDKDRVYVIAGKGEDRQMNNNEELIALIKQN